MSQCRERTREKPKRTPSFICEIPLKVTVSDERVLLARLEAGRQLYNACLGEAKRRVALVRQSRLYQRAHALPKDDLERRTLFAQARERYGFGEYNLHTYAGTLRQSWLGEHLDSLTAQKLASRAYAAANLLLLGRAKRVRFKGGHQMDTLEGKNNTSGIRWRTDHLEWNGLVLPGLLDPRDEVQRHGLASRVKYVRLVRRKAGTRNRFFAQLICEGTPYRKKRHALGEGVVGLDLGPQSIAIVAEQAASLEVFCPAVVPNAKRLRRLDRKIDRQRRANNPANYDEQGRVKQGAKHWRVSKRQRKTQAQRREYYRRLAATRKREQGQLAHRVLSLGNRIALEDLSYRAWQQRYGKSIALCAPGMFVARLRSLAASAGSTIVAINPRRAKLSQICQCGSLQNKRLSQRWHCCSCGANAQRDLYSAFLACFVHPETNLLDAGRAAAAWPGREPVLQAAYEQAMASNQPASGRRRPSSFGAPLRQSQSRSPAEGPQANAESRHAVPKRKRAGRGRKRSR
jgi:putative transposase